MHAYSVSLARKGSLSLWLRYFEDKERSPKTQAAFHSGDFAQWTGEAHSDFEAMDLALEDYPEFVVVPDTVVLVDEV
jgi:hypothetical protein